MKRGFIIAVQHFFEVYCLSMRLFFTDGNFLIIKNCHIPPPRFLLYCFAINIIIIGKMCQRLMSKYGKVINIHNLGKSWYFFAIYNRWKRLMRIQFHIRKSTNFSFHLPSFLRTFPLMLTRFVLSFRFCALLCSCPARLDSDFTATRLVNVGLVNSWFTHDDEEEAGSCFTWMSTGGEIVFVCTTFLVVDNNSLVTTVVPLLLETEVEVIKVLLDGACWWSFIVSIGFWDGMFVKIEDLDEGREEDNCPLLVNSVRDLPENLIEMWILNLRKFLHYWYFSTIRLEHHPEKNISMHIYVSIQ